MAAKLYRTSDGSYIVADDIFIQQGEGGWIASGILDEENLLALISGELDLYDFDLDAEQAEGLEDVVEVPHEQWASLLLP